MLFIPLIPRDSGCSVDTPDATSRAHCMCMCLPLIVLSGLALCVLSPDATCCSVHAPDATSRVGWWFSCPWYCFWDYSSGQYKVPISFTCNVNVRASQRWTGDEQTLNPCPMHADDVATLRPCKMNPCKSSWYMVDYFHSRLQHQTFMCAGLVWIVGEEMTRLACERRDKTSSMNLRTAIRASQEQHSEWCTFGVWLCTKESIFICNIILRCLIVHLYA